MKRETSREIRVLTTILFASFILAISLPVIAIGLAAAIRIFLLITGF